MFKVFFLSVFAAALVCLFSGCAAVETSRSTVPAPAKKVRIGLFVDIGANGNGLFHLASMIAHSPQAELVTLLGKDIREGKLKDVDVLVMPGGGSMTQCRSIGLKHYDKVRSFLKNGGAYVGTCAGMFNVLECRMKLLPFNRYPGAGGSTSSVWVKISPEGAKILGVEPGVRSVRYSGGPVAYPLKNSQSEGKGISLGVFQSSVCRLPKHGGKMLNAPALVYGTYGKGKVIATSFHPEYWESNHDLMLGCFYAVTGVKLTPVFPKKNYRPVRVGILSTAITGHAPVKTMLDLERHPDIDLDYVMLTELNQGILKHLDVLVLPHGHKANYDKYLTRKFYRQQLRTFLDRGGVVLAAGNAAPVMPEHKNCKKLPANTDFKKYILK